MVGCVSAVTPPAGTEPVCAVVASATFVMTGGATTAVKVNAIASDFGPVVPAAFVSVTVMLCEPLDTSLVGVNVHLPSVPILTEPIAVAPSYTVMMSPAVPVPLICGWPSDVVEPAGMDAPLSSVNTGVAGLAGVLVSTLNEMSVECALVPCELV